MATPRLPLAKWAYAKRRTSWRWRVACRRHCWGDGGVVLVGYSMGGVIAVKAGAQWDADPSLPPLRGVIAKSPYRFWDDGLRGQLRRRRLPEFVVVPALWLLLKLWKGLGGWARASTVLKTRPRLTVPLLVLHGDRDRICPLASGRAIAEAAADGELYVRQRRHA